jgi:hypothetical protein
MVIGISVSIKLAVPKAKVNFVLIKGSSTPVIEVKI